MSLPSQTAHASRWRSALGRDHFRAERWNVPAFLVLCLILALVPQAFAPPSAQAGPHAAVSPLAASVVSGQGVSAHQVLAPTQPNNQQCIAGVVTPTPTSTVVPSTVATTATPTTTPTPSPTPSPTPEAFPPSFQSCLVSATPAEQFLALGQSVTSTFVCGSQASPLVTPYAFGGCFDVHVTVTDATAGALVAAQGVSCGNYAAGTKGGGYDCGDVSNPICAAGFQPAASGACQPECPPGSTYEPAGNCQYIPIPATCPPGATAYYTASGLLGACIAAPITSISTANEVSVFLNPSSPHVFTITYTGFVGTLPGGSCPAGTTFTPNVNYRLAQGTSLGGPSSGPGCAFQIQSIVKLLEVTHLDIIPTSTCNEISSPAEVVFGGSPCYFRVRATGEVTLKTGVDCSSEPSGIPYLFPSLQSSPTSTPDTSQGVFNGGISYPVAPPTPMVPQYTCQDGNLEVLAPVPDVPIIITAQNGVFPDNSSCQPFEIGIRALSTVLPTPTGTLTPTSTPIPFPTDTPTPTATPFTSGPAQQAFCNRTGSQTLSVVTQGNGTAPLIPSSVVVAAVPSHSSTCVDNPFIPSTGSSTIVICARLLENGVGQPNARMYSLLQYPSGSTADDRCVPLGAFSNSSGRASCMRTIDASALQNAPPGTTIPVKVWFDLGGQLTGNFCSTTSELVVTDGGVTLPPQFATSCDVSTLGIAVVPYGYGALSVSATVSGTLNTQPPVSTGPVLLAEVTAPTVTPLPTPIPTATAPTAVSTSTPIPSPTSTFTPSPTPSPTSSATPTFTPSPTPTSTPTATPTPTPVPLRFALNAAYVARATSTGCDLHPLDSVLPGVRVCLLMNYTVQSLPHKESRLTTYEVLNGNLRIFVGSFKGTEQTRTTAIRFTTWQVPTGTAFGLYTFRATLKIDSQTKRHVWRFAILKPPP